jgi:hypothetical protein
MLLIACWCVPCAAPAHELPERVQVRMIGAIEPSALVLIVRVPLEAMRDVDFPLTPEGYLVIGEAEAALEEAAGLWIVDSIVLFERNRPVSAQQVSVRLALPGDRSMVSAERARAGFAVPAVDPDTRIYWRQALLDVMIRYPLSAPVDTGALTLDVAMQHLGARTRVEMRLVGGDGETHDLAFDGHVSGLALQPGWGRVARDFFVDGVRHILGGIDHLLFLLCLVLPIRRPWPLVGAVTAFTVAHSVTLGAAALGWVPSVLWFPSLVESLIAASIVFLAIENVLRTSFDARYLAAFVFGLAHGFGFASALRESLQFAQGQQLVAIATFNLGVEAGQLLVLTLLLPVFVWLFPRVPSPRALVIVVSLLVGHTGWHWMTERLTALSGYLF